MSHIKYKEVQRFTKKDVMILLAGLSLIGLFRLVQELVSANPDFGRAGILAAGVVFFTLILVYLRSLRLTTRYNEKNIKIKMAPFGLRRRKIRWKEVEEASVIDYSPAFIWSGWTVHFDSLQKMFNLDGEVLLHLILKSGEQLSIGCSSGSDLQAFLDKAREYNPEIRIS